MYLEGTEHRTAAFNKLTQGDAGAARVIEQRMKKLIKLQVRWAGRTAAGAMVCWQGSVKHVVLAAPQHHS